MFCYKGCYFGLFFFFKQKTAYEFSACLVGSEMCIRDRCYLISFTAFVLLKGKNYYLAPIYPMLFAAGAITLENGIERVRQGWLKTAILVLLLAGGAWFAPIVVPVLPIDRFIAYLDTLPFKVPRTEHSHMSAALPQHYADQFGWEEMTAMTAQA